jgi:hypothetical protein
MRMSHGGVCNRFWQVSEFINVFVGNDDNVGIISCEFKDGVFELLQL